MGGNPKPDQQKKGLMSDQHNTTRLEEIQNELSALVDTKGTATVTIKVVDGKVNCILVDRTKSCQIRQIK